MKEKLTTKYLKENYKHIIVLEHNLFDYITKELSILGYHSSTFGWDYDAYRITNDIIIIEGYRPPNNQGITKKELEKIKNVFKASNNIIKDYYNSRCTYETLKQVINNEIEYVTNYLIDLLN